MYRYITSKATVRREGVTFEGYRNRGSGPFARLL